MIKDKPKILIFCDYYLPGYKSGGGMRTIVNMVDRLHRSYDFRIVTRDHDGKLDRNQYKDVLINDWNNVRNAQVYYLSKDNMRISKLRELILEVRPDSVYVNSFFATPAIYVLKLRKLRLIPDLNVIVAPCGELSEGSLKLKSTKKKFFINLAKLSGLYKNVLWKASSELEFEEIRRAKGKGGKIFISPDLPPKSLLDNFFPAQKPEKKAGEAKMIFLSRFSPKKNFKFVLENLGKVLGKLEIDVYGPLEDSEYWNECLEIIERLPSNIKIKARGPIPYEEVCDKLLEYHFFILPTLSENFGHVFPEALAAGCPLIISDRTPWLDLAEKGIGWDLPLEKPALWQKTINDCIGMNQTEYKKISGDARSYIVAWLADPKIEKNTVEILEYSLSETLAK